ncbi:MAG TPA: hypothetical protein PK295_03645 [Candidatus Magasanikbacteria bacterium]|nr:hypothetical protein [Candidatus Magasanikbacteria bacterium]
MKTYLISYDLTKPDSNAEYTMLLKMIKSANRWSRPLKSMWLIQTDLSSLDIVNQLKSVVDVKDKIYVTEITRNWASINLSNSLLVGAN